MVRLLHEIDKNYHENLYTDIKNGDRNLFYDAFPIFSNLDFKRLTDSTLDRLIDFVRTYVLDLPSTYDSTIAEFFYNEEEISEYFEAPKHLVNIIKELDEDDFEFGSNELFCYGYLMYGEDYFNRM